MDTRQLKDYDTVTLDDKHNQIHIIDQTRLPGEIVILKLSTQEQIWDAIYRLAVRGAPAIGITAAFGIYLAAKAIPADTIVDFYAAFCTAKDYLNSSRPTAVNLSWALERMEQCLLAHKTQPITVIIEALHQEANAIYNEDIAVCKAIGEHGLTLLKPGDSVLTHCNAGRLACVKYGTATAPIYLAKEQGIPLRVFVDETRPLLQGARLTAYELQAAGVDVTLVCDNMAHMAMRHKQVNAVFVGCDRVAANGDTANKIGTAMVALAAQYNHVPMYICAPTSTIDMETATGAEIVIEERPAQEVTEMWYKQPMAPKGINVYNPAFDITDHNLITGIITEYGIVYPPYGPALQEIFEQKKKTHK